MQPRKLSALMISFIFMVEIELYYLWMGTPDLALPLYHIQYHDAYLAYGVLWTWLNPNWWTDFVYKAELTVWVIGLAAFEYWLYSKRKLPLMVLIMAQFQNTIWFFVGGYQNITLNASAVLSFWNPFFAITWFLQKFPIGWSFPDVTANSHWQCAFGNVTIGYTLKGIWYQGCGPGLLFGRIILDMWHVMELVWIGVAGIYWSVRFLRWLIKRLKKKDSIECCRLEDYQKRLKLDGFHMAVLKAELPYWHVAYLPVKGTVLDVGAGNGETALFYLLHGANKVVCIEPNATLLQENFKDDDRVTIVPMAVDTIKIDGEGCEEGMVVETHFPYVVRELRDGKNSPRAWRIMPVRCLKFVEKLIFITWVIIQKYRQFRLWLITLCKNRGEKQ